MPLEESPLRVPEGPLHVLLEGQGGLLLGPERLLACFGPVRVQGRRTVTTSARKRVPRELRVAVLRCLSAKPDVFVAMDQTTRHSGSKLSSQTGPVGRRLYQWPSSQSRRPLTSSSAVGAEPRHAQAWVRVSRWPQMRQ